ncbi:MraY family glycosyltransferase [Arcticibacterium luteifluviistationis]|uniref:UDP-GlcNAc--UDP-phosphate GlcNAc-1-phosphate transferase n=1 Tax=Arcticibacterium luteifluviistationis TaxID=1784714 RepID=A0A2Z4GFM6_9BACT|nr:glycosyltransferase family 4 protein [Arcticibacterium luteifluviistationis]AWV99855.1 UDP-GlcNAc--UDP-phosphate GlcNAc-1-phosphate transferase [Arcticibacterium luteifluviistationis]
MSSLSVLLKFLKGLLLSLSIIKEMSYFFSFLAIVLSSYFYIQIAEKFNITDVPNERSSHREITVRGLGIVFVIPVILFFVQSGFSYPFFMFGFILAAGISIIDDIYTVSSKIRLFIQIASVGFLLFELAVPNESFYYLTFLLILGVGIVNGFNFMDGINGLTGLYSLISLLTLIYINQLVILFIELDFLILMVLGVLIFLFFNFRKKARGFSGDVGSVGIGLVLCFFIFQLIFTTNDWRYIFLFFVYGLDTLVTIVIRLVRKENIFEAHRKHLYQLLANERGVSHLNVSISYGIAQILLNAWIISYREVVDFVFFIPFILTFILTVLLRIRINRESLLPNNKI